MREVRGALGNQSRRQWRRNRTLGWLGSFGGGNSVEREFCRQRFVAKRVFGDITPLLIELRRALASHRAEGIALALQSSEARYCRLRRSTPSRVNQLLSRDGFCRETRFWRHNSPSCKLRFALSADRVAPLQLAPNRFVAKFCRGILSSATEGFGRHAMCSSLARRDGASRTPFRGRPGERVSFQRTGGTRKPPPMNADKRKFQGIAADRSLQCDNLSPSRIAPMDSSAFICVYPRFPPSGMNVRLHHRMRRPWPKTTGQIQNCEDFVGPGIAGVSPASCSKTGLEFGARAVGANSQA
jgi:hypothetical protein